MYATVADDNIASLTSLRRGCTILGQRAISPGYHLYALAPTGNNE